MTLLTIRITILFVCRRRKKAGGEKYYYKGKVKLHFILFSIRYVYKLLVSKKLLVVMLNLVKKKNPR